MEFVSVKVGKNNFLQFEFNEKEESGLLKLMIEGNDLCDLYYKSIDQLIEKLRSPFSNMIGFYLKIEGYTNASIETACIEAANIVQSLYEK